MEFKNSHVYTALNADYLRPGDKVIVADSLAELRNRVIKDTEPKELKIIKPASYTSRFEVKEIAYNFVLAYLIEKVNNCINCNKTCYTNRSLVDKTMGCINWEPKPEQEDKKPKYRPFNGTGELIQTWLDKGGKWQKRELTMPLIWVRRKDNHTSIDLITGFGQIAVSIGIAGNSMQTLFNEYEFLDGSPCGVEIVE